MDHITRAHEKYEEIVMEARRQKINGYVFSTIIVSKRARGIVGWLEVIIDDLEPFNAVGNPFKLKNEDGSNLRGDAQLVHAKGDRPGGKEDRPSTS